MNTWTQDELRSEYATLRSQAAAQFLQHRVLAPVAFLYATKPKKTRICMNLVYVLQTGEAHAFVQSTARKHEALSVVTILESWMVVQEGEVPDLTAKQVRGHGERQEVLQFLVESTGGSPVVYFAPIHRSGDRVELGPWQLVPGCIDVATPTVAALQN